MKKTTKKIVSLFLALALILTTIGAGIGAYFTGTDKKSDTYTIGQIEVELVGEDDLYKAEKLTPNYEYDFTRSVKNIGINDAYVFMAVTIPCDDVFLHNLEGNHIDDAALTQLFTYGVNEVAGVNGEWVLVTEGQFGDYDIADMAGRLVNNSDEKGALRTNDTATYIYAYVGNGDTLARLAPDAETTALFNIMKFANVSDTEITHNIENTVGKIKTQVFAIQCDNVLETEYMTGNNADGSEQVNAVWAVVNNALVRTNDIANDKISIPVTAFDKDGNDLNASATVIEGQEADKLLDALENQGLANKADVDLLIDVKSDDFDDLADTTFDVSDVAKDGDTVIILHYNEKTQKWEHINTDTVEDGKVGGDFSSYSPVVIIVVPKDEGGVEEEPTEPEEELVKYELTNGYTFNNTLKTAAGNNLSAVQTLSFGDYEIPEAATTYDVSNSRDGSIILWYDNGHVYVTYTGEEDGVFATNKSPNMMFYGCSGLTSLDLTNFNTSNATDMTNMFSGCSGLTSLDVSNFDTSNVSNMSGMFSNCKVLTSLDVSKFNTSQVTSMSNMFSYCQKLTSLDVSKFDTSNVTDMGHMFSNCKALTSLNVSNFITDKVTNMNFMFMSCKGLTSLDVSNFNTSQVTAMNSMFNSTGVTSLDLSNFDTSKVTGMGGMFFGCSSLTSVNLSSFNTSQVTSMTEMFRGCSNLTSLDVAHFDTNNVTNMNGMFYNCSGLTTLDLSNFDTSKVTTMNWAFCGCKNLTTIYAGDWTPASEISSTEMFKNCSKLVGAVSYDKNNIDISMANPTTGYFTTK